MALRQRAARVRRAALAGAILLGYALVGAARAHGAAPATPPGANSPRSCAARAANHRLDFWIGDWDVYAAGALDGTDHIATILNGCVVEESWHDATGYEGRSWFFVDPTTGRLKQVWVTTEAGEPGGTKEKAELPATADGSVRFQGTIRDPSGTAMLDRTTLSCRPDGTVRQVIERSRDGGRSWRVAYAGAYKRRARP